MVQEQEGIYWRHLHKGNIITGKRTFYKSGVLGTTLMGPGRSVKMVLRGGRHYGPFQEVIICLPHVFCFNCQHQEHRHYHHHTHHSNNQYSHHQKGHHRNCCMLSILGKVSRLLDGLESFLSGQIGVHGGHYRCSGHIMAAH